jgi:uncharacterized membrane protein
VIPILSETELEHKMGRLLQAGVMLAGLVMIGGGALYLGRYGKGTAQYGTLRGEAPELKTIPGVLHGAMALHPAAVIQLAVLLMIATPVLRIAFAVFGFALQRDWLYMLISALVLGLVSYGLLAAG